MIGWDKSKTFWKVLKIDRLEPYELNIIEDCATYSEMECHDLLKRIHDGNAGGLKFVTLCYGIVGRPHIFSNRASVYSCHLLLIYVNKIILY